MKTTPSDLKVIPEAKDEQNSGVLESSHPTEITKAEGVPSARMKPSQIPTEITEDEDGPLSGLESYHTTTSTSTKDEQSAETQGTESKPQANPFMKDLPKADGGLEALKEHLRGLKKLLKNKLDDLQFSMFLLFNSNDMTGVLQTVEELFYLFDAIEFLIEKRVNPLDSKQGLLKADYLRIDIYAHLFIALSYKERLNGKKEKLIVFLINKARGEEDIMTPTLSKNLITDCILMHEEETISVFIFHVLKDERKEAEDLFKGLINSLKPSDFFNRGRLYNNALQKVENMSEVHKFLTSGRLSQRYCHVVQDIDRLNIAMDHGNQVKVHNFLVDDLYLRDVEQKPEVMQGIDWAFVERHDYPYLVKCLWAQRNILHPCQYEWTQVESLVKYAFTSSPAISVGGLDIMKCLLENWPELDVNASYKSVTALHVAAYTGNEEVVKYLLEHFKGLDILVRTGRKKLNTNRWNLSAYQTALHIATAQKHARVVEILCNPPELHQQRMRCHEEDDEERTPLDILYAKVSEEGGDFGYGADSLSEIEKILLGNKDVQSGLDRLYRNRQVIVDAVNTILVGAALIAGVTFAGWLQPPLGYAQYYDLATPYPAPVGTYDSYIAVQGNLGIKVFALFNSLSFFFAIATIIVAADAAFPSRRYKYIGHIIKTMQLLLQRAITFLIISLVCVLGAFGGAAIVILPPSLFFRKDLVLTIIIGGGVCCITLWQLLSRHSERVQRLNDYIVSVISLTNVF